MTKKTFKFDPGLWMHNRTLRTCSAAARGFWIDLLCLCHPEGYLLLNGQPMSDTDISRLTGEPVKSVRAWLKELGEAGIYSVDDKGLYSSKMVKEYVFSSQAKAFGSRGQKIKKEKSEKTTVSSTVKLDLSKIEQKQYEYAITNPVTPAMDDKSRAMRVALDVVAAAPTPAKVGKSLPWYKSPAGWVRYGQTQAVSMNSGEELEDFKFRLSCKIPPGQHLEELTAYHKKEVMRIIDQHAPKDGEQRKNYAQDR